MTDALLTALSSTPIIALCLLIRTTNYNRAERKNQYFMPFFGIVFIVIAVFLSNQFCELANWLIHSIPQWIAALSEVSWMPEFLAGFFKTASQSIADFINNMNLNYLIFQIASIVIVLIYMLYKKYFFGLFRLLHSKIELLREYKDKTNSKYYEYIPEGNIWCVKKSCIDARNYLKVFYYTALVITAILIMLSNSFYMNGFFRTAYFPVLGIIAIGEFYFYLCGYTKNEYKNKYNAEGDDSFHTANYSLLRKYLRTLFGDKLSCENTTVNKVLELNVTNDEIIEKLEHSEDPKISTFGLYIKKLNSDGFPLDKNYIYSSVDLLNGKNILFNNPFYNDLIPYAFYPMNRTLLSHKKVLVVLGRHAIEKDIEEWIKKGIGAVTNIPDMWNIACLDDETASHTDIGIITRSNVINMKLHEENSEFFKNVGYFVIIEPSKLVSTAQLGLNLIIKNCRESNENIVFCMCDKNCDGLVDAMSHILMTSITEVSATQKHLGSSSYMCWNSDDEYLHHRLLPNISRYLGIGTELSFSALKNQVIKTTWYGGDVFPVSDMKWIVGQYYYDLMKYAGLPSSQEYMDEVFVTSSGFYNADIRKNNYITVEDESNNMFEAVRDFSTRATEQGFINVISGEYLLKDYMADNFTVFETDAKAIPYISADYARTNRNVILRILLVMSKYGATDTVIQKEFSLLAEPVYDIKKQLWYEIYHCFASTAELSDILCLEYKKAVNFVYDKKITLSDGYKIDSNIITVKEKFNFDESDYERMYYISDSDFIRNYISDVQSAGYVAEDEKGKKYYLGAELRGHIYQKYLPGQFFTFGGKYYEMQYLTADNQVLVRRASDHINSRNFYRQIRNYEILGIIPSNKIDSHKNISGLKIIKEFADIKVSTAGYYIMNRYNDFSSAKKVLFENTSSKIPDRIFRNKEIIRIDLPEQNGFNNSIRYTVTLLFNEIFRTIFADNQNFISAITDTSFITDDIEFTPNTYSVNSICKSYSTNSIYIIEDSQLDLGLSIAFERNIDRIFDIINDYLMWHTEKITESLCGNEFNCKNNADIKNDTVRVTEKDENNTDAQNQNFAERIKDFFKKLFGGKKEKGTIFTDDEEEDDNTPTEDVVLFKKPAYHTNYYLMYGMKGEPKMLDITGTSTYLSQMLASKNNSMLQVRNSKKIIEFVEKNYRPDKKNMRYCHFCGAEILGVEYETLIDGRDRCINCSRTAIRSEKEFINLFEEIKRNMESVFNIRINVGIKVEMVGARRILKAAGHTFTPSSKNNPHICGLAIKNKDGFTLLIENGSPRIKAILTIAHELTHIWQYINWNSKQIKKLYGSDLELEIYEGMAKWVEIQYAYAINEVLIAKREEIITAYRDDEYGRGFLRFRLNYPLTTSTVISGKTPFMNVKKPLSAIYCGDVSIPVEFLSISQNDDDGNGDNKRKSNNTIKPLQPDNLGIIERNPQEISYYHYNTLSNTEKEIYDVFLSAIKNYDKKVVLGDNYSITGEQGVHIQKAIKYDHPELIWYEQDVSYYHKDEMNSEFVFDYVLSKEETEKRLLLIEKAADAFLTGIDKYTNDFNAVLKIYNNLISLVDYDSAGLAKQNQITITDKPDDLRSVYGMLVNRKGVCAGYAVAFQYLLQKIGIEAAYVVGEVKASESSNLESHAWNLIKLEGDYYFVDVTWDDQSNTMPEKNYSNEISHKYFCINSAELSLDHILGNEFIYPVCTAIKCNYYCRKDLYFDIYSFDKIKMLAIAAVKSHLPSFEIKFANQSTYNTAVNELIIGEKFYDILQSVNLKLGKKVNSSSYKYAESNDGKWILKFIFSYM